jgi:archaellum biogenesis ATPase FlaH
LLNNIFSLGIKNNTLGFNNMGLAITIPGLDEFVKEIPEGNVILIQGDTNPIKSIFAQKLAGSARKKGRNVNYISSRAGEEVKEQISYYNGNIDFQIIEERSSHHWKNYIKENTLTIIDSFSYLILNKNLNEVQVIMEELDKLCKQRNNILLLTMEEGMLDEKVNITVAHLADGIFCFLYRDTKQGVARFIRIPKWMNRESFDDNIYYSFDGKNINVDLRARVT